MALDRSFQATAENVESNRNNSVKNAPRISVITPSYNQVEFLEQTIDSVLSQAYPNLEYIVMDGGSTDGSRAIIERYSDRLAYWVSEPDAGQSDAINKGFERATGEIFCWINSDDFLEPGALATVGAYFGTNPDWLAINGGCRLVNMVDGRPDLHGPVRKLDCPAKTAIEKWTQYWFAQQSTVWRRDLWERVGPLRRDLNLVMDLDLWRRFSNVTCIQPVPEILANYRFHDAAKCVADHRAVALEIFSLSTEGIVGGNSQLADTARHQIEDLATRIDELNDQVRNKQIAITELHKQISILQSRVAARDSDIESLRRSKWLRLGAAVSRLRRRANRSG